MDKRPIIIFFLMLVFMAPCNAHSGELSGRRVMEIQKERHGVKTDRSTVVMLLINKKGHKKKRMLERWGKRFKNGLHRGIIAFKEPKDISGTVLLTWELEKGKSKQWLYLPSQKKLQRVSGQSKKNYFMGTDFTYEDLQAEAIENYDYTILRSEAVDGKDCYVIQVLPATRERKKESAYSKRIVWVRKDIFFTVKIEFYDRRKRLLKTQTNHDLTNQEGKIWMAKKSLMVHHKTKHKTLLGIRKREINIPIDDTIFTERFILSGRLLR